MTPKVLFINPPSVPYNHLVKMLADEHTTLTQAVSMPMGILYLSAVLQRDFPDIEIQIVDLAKAIRDFEESGERKSIDWHTFIEHTIRKKVRDGFVPHFTGISTLFSTAHKSTIHIAQAVKKIWPDHPVVLGGMHSTNATDTLLREDSVDFICRGEGESIISDVLTAVLGNKDVESIQGMIGRKKLANKALDTAPVINDLDEIPFPAWDLLDMPSYTFSMATRARNIDAIEQDGEATIITTRGCPFRCTFCASWTVHGRKMRFRSTENVIAELRILKEKYNATSLIPEDDLFTVKKERIINLCNTIYEEFSGELHFQFPNGLSVATLDEEVIEALVKMGMTVANIAIESGSEYVQRNVIEKNCNLDRARHVVQHCRDTGIVTRTYFIMGFPGETREHMQETIDFMLKLPSDWNVINHASPLIGTKMHHQLLERGDIDESFNWDNSFFYERSYDTDEIQAEELKDLIFTTNLRVNFFENYNLRIGEYERPINLWKQILSAYPNHLVAQYCIAMAYDKMSKIDERQKALQACVAMLECDKSDLAQLHYAHFKDEMTLLELPQSMEFAHIATQQGPRPGMPHEPKKHI